MTDDCSDYNDCWTDSTAAHSDFDCCECTCYCSTITAFVIELAGSETFGYSFSDYIILRVKICSVRLMMAGRSHPDGAAS